jgi:hypothetical protein
MIVLLGLGLDRLHSVEILEVMSYDHDFTA